MRPGCSRPATARITFDSTESAVWIDPVGDDPVPASELCRMHADALHAPLGWMVNDRRPDAPAAEPGRRRPGGPDPVEPGPAERAPMASDEEVDDPGDVGADPHDELGGVTGMETGDESGSSGSEPPGPERNILDRAFGWTGPQRSVLTQPAVAPPEADEERHPV